MTLPRSPDVRMLVPALPREDDRLVARNREPIGPLVRSIADAFDRHPLLRLRQRATRAPDHLPERPGLSLPRRAAGRCRGDARGALPGGVLQPAGPERLPLRGGA